MAVTNGNRQSVIKNTSNAVSPVNRRITWATNQSPPPPTLPSGDFLLVHIAVAANKSVQWVKHGTDNLTKATLSPMWRNTPGVRHEFWYKNSSDASTPESGLKQIQVQFNSTYFNGVSICAMCFSGATGIGTTHYFGNQATPHTRSMSVSAGSQVYGASTSTGAYVKMIMDGVNVLPANLKPNQANINKVVVGALTTSPVSAGTIDVVAQPNPFGVGTNVAIEILASGGGGGSTRGRRILIT
tara:strand:+ start:286 stop:1011 length:726 start_codon:yes stop_codon:yes gene_type:complete